VMQVVVTILPPLPGNVKFHVI